MLVSCFPALATFLVAVQVRAFPFERDSQGVTLKEKTCACSLQQAILQTDLRGEEQCWVCQELYTRWWGSSESVFWRGKEAWDDDQCHHRKDYQPMGLQEQLGLTLAQPEQGGEPAQPEQGGEPAQPEQGGEPAQPE